MYVCLLVFWKNEVLIHSTVGRDGSDITSSRLIVTKCNCINYINYKKITHSQNACILQHGRLVTSSFQKL